MISERGDEGASSCNHFYLYPKQDGVREEGEKDRRLITCKRCL